MRRLSRVAVVMSLVFLAAQSARYGLSDYMFGLAKQSYRSEASSDTAADTAMALASLERIDQALLLSSNNAAALDLQAIVLYRLWLLQAEGFNEQDTLAKAVDANQRALAVRPHWPYSYLSIATISVMQFEQLNQQFYLAFDKAYEYGRYDSVVALHLLFLSARNWSRLDFVYRMKAVELARLSLYQKSNSPRYMGQVLRRLGVLSEMCGRLPDNDRVQQMCNV